MAYDVNVMLAMLSFLRKHKRSSRNEPADLRFGQRIPGFAVKHQSPRKPLTGRLP